MSSKYLMILIWLLMMIMCAFLVFTPTSVIKRIWIASSSYKPNRFRFENLKPWEFTMLIWTFRFTGITGIIAITWLLFLNR